MKINREIRAPKVRVIDKDGNQLGVITLSEALPLDDPLRRQPDIQKAKKLLQWEPKISLRDGLMDMIKDFQKI